MARTAREAVAVFDAEDTLEQAIDDLERHGFDRSDISLLAGEATVDEKLHHRYRRVEEVEDNPDAPRLSYVSRQAVHEGEAAAVAVPLYFGAMTATGVAVAAGGPVGAAIVAAIVGGGMGGALGSILAAWIDTAHANHIDRQIGHGGIVLWVHVRDHDHETRALEILRRHSAHDVHLHDVPEDALG